MSECTVENGIMNGSTARDMTFMRLKSKIATTQPQSNEYSQGKAENSHQSAENFHQSAENSHQNAENSPQNAGIPIKREKTPTETSKEPPITGGSLLMSGEIRFP
ncbi:MAG: hypothetical protein IJB84_05340 [Lachnospiraceae bacterium]|nr:hypothetical protein [Lachnospiraceae bacterium]